MVQISYPPLTPPRALLQLSQLRVIISMPDGTVAGETCNPLQLFSLVPDFLNQGISGQETITFAIIHQ